MKPDGISPEVFCLDNCGRLDGAKKRDRAVVSGEFCEWASARARSRRCSNGLVKFGERVYRYPFHYTIVRRTGQPVGGSIGFPRPAFPRKLSVPRKPLLCGRSCCALNSTNGMKPFVVPSSRLPLLAREETSSAKKYYEYRT